MGEWYAKKTMGMLPAEAAQRWGSREALVFKDQRWTYAEFDAEVDRMAKGLMALGVQSGEKVSLWMNNKPEWLFLMYAIPKVGGVLVPLNTRYRTDDISYVVAQSNSGTLISDDCSGPIDYMSMISEVMPDLSGDAGAEQKLEKFPDCRRVVFAGTDKLDGSFSLDDVVEMGASVSDADLAARAGAVDPDALMLIGYTSGTTGDPKGVMHNHINIRCVADRMAMLGITFNDTHICYLPLFHAYGLSEVAMSCILTGARQILTETFNAEEALDIIQSEKVTLAHGFEAHWNDLLRAQDGQPRDVSSLRLGTLPAGTEATIPTAEKAQDVFCPTISGFGMTEIWAYVSMSFATDTREQRVNASGFPINGVEFAVGDPDTHEILPPNTRGELMFKGYSLMMGYYEKPEATANSFSDDGWFLTGDLGVLRDDGQLVFMGRYKDMLKVGGENVAPAEIEARLFELPGVMDVAVVAYPDPRLDEVAVAFIIRTDGTNLTEDEVLAHVKGRIASFKIPRHVLFVDEFPMTSSGKIQKVKLRALALEVLGQPKVA
jgi:fatty-acyl-CoA synthase